MNQGLIIGGLLPAIFFGLTGILAKIVSQKGIAPPAYLFFAGVGYIVAGFIAYPFFKSADFNSGSAFVSVLIGISQATGMALVFYALFAFASPMSQLAPLYNTNTLIAVVLSLIIFSEWQEVNTFKVLFGAVLIVVGSYFVSVAK